MAETSVNVVLTMGAGVPMEVSAPFPRLPDRGQRFYYPELDAVRIFLFFGVWAYHILPREMSFYTNHHLPASIAFVAVSVIKTCMCSLDVFFILSAYLITELLLREREQKGEVHLKAFYVRRLLRIWPLYFFVIGVACLLSAFDPAQSVGWAYAISFLLFAGNWMMVLRGAPHGVSLVPLWSVSFEEQFYLLWPLVLRRASRKTIFAITLGLLLVASMTRLFLLLRHEGGDPIWYNSFARLDSIAFGIMLALLLHGRSIFRLGTRVRVALICLGLAAWFVVGGTCGLLDRTPPLAGGLIGYPLMSLGGVAIFLAILGAASNGIPWLKNPTLVYFGKISYGLYLYHMLSLRLAGYLFAGRSFAFSRTLTDLCALALTFLLAMASFKWLETPFLRLKQTRFTYVPSGAPSS